MPNNGSHTKVGVYVDVANLSMNGGFGMRYDVLREFACRGAGEPVRLNAYVSYDSARGADDPVYRQKQEGFQSMLRDAGFKVIEKPVRWYIDERGERYGKANVDLDLAVDALLQSENLDRVLLATGDGDFVQVVRALQNRGCRVEVVGFESVSSALRREADLFMSGYVIPNLQSTADNRNAPPWGQLGSRVRGVCYHHPGKGYGFLRIMQRISPEIWKVDTRDEASPYESVFCHDTNFPAGVNLRNLPSRDIIFEFELAQGDKGFQATNVRLVGGKG